MSSCREVCEPCSYHRERRINQQRISPLSAHATFSRPSRCSDLDCPLLLYQSDDDAAAVQSSDFMAQVLTLLQKELFGESGQMEPTGQ